MNNVYLLDIDNTLLDNDLIKDQIKQSLEKVLGKEEANHFWEHNNSFRENEKFVNFPVVIEEYCQEQHKETCDLTLSNIFENIDFKFAVYPDVPQLIEALKKTGEVYLFTEGDDLYQKLKMEKSGLMDLVDGVFLFRHKLDHLEEIKKKFSDKKLIFVDDKPQTLIKIKKSLPNSTVVEVCQGHYSKEDHILHKKFDATIDKTSELLDLEFVSK